MEDNDPTGQPAAPRPQRVPPYDLSGVSTRSLEGRPALVGLDHLAALADPAAQFTSFLDSLPDVLAARSLRALADQIGRANRGGYGVAVAMGGHVVKTGCSPLIIDLMRRGVVTSLHMAGSTAIHDYELARVGATSEDVAAGLEEGRYGMADETGAAFAVASRRGSEEGIGLGAALGQGMLDSSLPNNDVSLVAEAALLGIPCTVHIAIGTDTVHMHPAADGADMGQASHLDFRIACTVVSELDHGVWLNLGSAVVMPEVFLKCVTVARNTGNALDDLTSANFDMLQHYRPLTNVVRRPVARGYNFTGHHEIMLPLLRLAVLAELAS